MDERTRSIAVIFAVLAPFSSEMLMINLRSNEPVADGGPR